MDEGGREWMRVDEGGFRQKHTLMTRKFFPYKAF